MSKFRKDRVAELLREVISDIIRIRIKDPRVQGVTITDVEMTADLKAARVYYCRLGAGEDKSSQEGLEAAQGFIRHHIRSELDLKYIPQLTFFYDTSFDTYARINGILKDLEHTQSDDDSESSSNTKE
jgi:ribosome-binding factor A